MKIYRISAPLPLDEIALERGGEGIDLILTDEIIQKLDNKYHFEESLGEGEFGIAFRISGNKVIKFTTDSMELKAAQLIMGAPYGPFAEVYEVSPLGTKDNAHYIVKELVTPLNEEQEYIFLELGNVYYDDDEVEMLKETYSGHESFIEECIDYFSDVVNYAFTDTFSPSNVGINSNGSVVAFDARLV